MDTKKVTIFISDIELRTYLLLVDKKMKGGYKSWKDMIITEILGGRIG